MMIRNKQFPYPVIANGNDSYSNSSFYSDVNVEKNGYHIQFCLKASTNNEALNELIRTKKVIIVHHIESVQTCYRHAVTTDEEEIVYQIHQSKLSGIVQINTLLVANEDINGYKNPDFSSDYKGFSFNIKRGCLMAIGQCVEIELNKQKDDLENTSSIFSIVPILDSNENAISVEVSTTKAKILIHVPHKSCNIYKNLSANLELQGIMHSMIIVPALIQVFDELKKSSQDLYEYSSCRWFKALKKACKKLKIELDEQNLANLDSYRIAQLLMDCPTIRALDYLAGGSVNED